MIEGTLAQNGKFCITCQLSANAIHQLAPLQESHAQQFQVSGLQTCHIAELGLCLVSSATERPSQNNVHVCYLDRRVGTTTGKGRLCSRTETQYK